MPSSAAPVSTLQSAPPSAPAPLQVEALIKRFGDLTAVDGISLELRPGECFGLLGPNGAGKSTLIRAIVGRVLPDSGQALVFGFPAASSQARMALGWVPQELAIYPRLTARENLRAFGSYAGLKGRKLQDAIAWCLHWAALEDRAGELAGKLSGGMKRRLNMAAGLIHQPRLVLMDEPTVGVDPQSRNRIFEMIEALRASGTTLIYTTHYMEEAERLCDRIAIIDHGRIIALDTREGLVRASFGTRSVVSARLAGDSEAIAAWTAQHGGRIMSAAIEGAANADPAAEFTVENPAQIAVLLDSASAAGIEFLDLSLRRPNLESVFLHLTGRELRD
ncbi:MAG: ABC transporter ATP-binding protein [Acidobacteriota bacterium]